MKLVPLTLTIIRHHMYHIKTPEARDILSKYKYYDVDQKGFHMYSEKYAKEKGYIK